MLRLVLALYAEGATDDLFLPLVIQRTSRMILAQYGQNRVNVPEIELIRLNEAVQKAYANRSKRQRKIDIDFLYQPMGEKIRLERSSNVPAYQQFVRDLTDTLKNLNLIQ